MSIKTNFKRRNLKTMVFTFSIYLVIAVALFAIEYTRTIGFVVLIGPPLALVLPLIGVFFIGDVVYLPILLLLIMLSGVLLYTSFTEKKYAKLKRLVSAVLWLLAGLLCLVAIY